MSGLSRIISGELVTSTIRMAEAHDMGWIARIAPDVFDYPISPETMAAYLASPLHFLLIAESDGLVVGQLSAVIHRHPDERPAELYIDEVGVSPDFQRRGIASLLLNAAFSEGRRQGCKEAWLGTEPDNVPAQALYGSRATLKDEITMFVFDLAQG
jgi:ribosomal protein S18 acetylase RimI-like enzyme